MKLCGRQVKRKRTEFVDISGTQDLREGKETPRVAELRSARVSKQRTIQATYRRFRCQLKHTMLDVTILGQMSPSGMLLLAHHLVEGGPLLETGIELFAELACFSGLRVNAAWQGSM